MSVRSIALRRRPNPRLDQFRRTWYFFRRNTLAIIGLGILVFFACLFVASFLYPASSTELTIYQATNGAAPSSHALYPEVCTYQAGEVPPAPNCYLTPTGMPSVIGPTATLHPAGLGPLPFGSLTLNPAGQTFYDTFDGLIKGAQWSLTISVGVVTSGALIGILLGVVAGYYGGVVDEVIMRITDIFLSIPGLLLVIITLAIFAPSITSLWTRVGLVIAAFVVVAWPTYARIVRSQVLIVREQRYVEAAKASGAKGGRILRKHILPNSIYPVFVQMSFDVGTIPLLIAAIVFIGFQVFPKLNFPEWGTITAFSVQGAVLASFITACQSASALGGGCTFPWWQFFFPGLTLFLFAISVSFFADGLRDALDPRLRR
ncbi:MAG: ABC transporter permease [Thermoplasmata archaeon]|jgi:peptide/nickel transport system permease protein